MFFKDSSDVDRDYPDLNRIIDDMFRMAFVRCDYEGDCSTCPNRTMCT